MSDDLVKRLRDWEHVGPEDIDKPEGHLYEEAADRIEELEAKLAKAVEAIQCWDTMLDNSQYDLGEMAEEFTTIVRTTLKELTGGKDE